MTQPNPAELLADGRWLAHRFVESSDAIRFLHLERADHERVIFITDDYLPKDRPQVELPRGAAVAMAKSHGQPLHFIFHSAFCCSTLLARAFDWPGRATALKEPVLLNDLVGYRRRGAPGRAVAEILDGALALLARPIGPGEAVIVKPSNVLNGLAQLTLTMRPATNAVLLYAPLRDFITSVAKKGLDGRIWARQLFLGFRTDGLTARLGFSDTDYFGQTDLQIAASGWLIQQAIFADLLKSFGTDRVRSLRSDALLAQPAKSLAALAVLFGVRMSAEEASAIAAGDAFRRNSKSGEAYDGQARAEDYRQAASEHADEIEKVTVWASRVAESLAIPLLLPRGLI